MSASSTQVLLVPYMDGAWAGFDPLSPEVGYSAPPFSLTEVTENMKAALQLMGELAGGRFVFGAHTGVYCREPFYEEPLLGHYRELVEHGAEIAVYPHEEIVGEGTIVTSTRHMRKIITEKTQQLRDAGIEPTSYRGGYCAYDPALTAILEEVGIDVDLSAAPGQVNPQWSEEWADALPSAYYLCAEDPYHGACGHRKSGVLEIPMGWDGDGTSWAANYLNEDSTLDSMKRTWERILARAEESGEQQIVYFMTHLFAVADATLLSRCRGILEHAAANGGRIVAPSEAKAAFDAQRVGETTSGGVE